MKIKQIYEKLKENLVIRIIFSTLKYALIILCILAAIENQKAVNQNEPLKLNFEYRVF